MIIVEMNQKVRDRAEEYGPSVLRVLEAFVQELERNPRLGELLTSTDSMAVYKNRLEVSGDGPRLLVTVHVYLVGGNPESVIIQSLDPRD